LIEDVLYFFYLYSSYHIRIFIKDVTNIVGLNTRIAKDDDLALVDLFGMTQEKSKGITAGKVMVRYIDKLPNKGTCFFWR